MDPADTPLSSGVDDDSLEIPISGRGLQVQDSDREVGVRVACRRLETRDTRQLSVVFVRKMVSFA